MGRPHSALMHVGLLAFTDFKPQRSSVKRSFLYANHQDAHVVSGGLQNWGFFYSRVLMRSQSNIYLIYSTTSTIWRLRTDFLTKDYYAHKNLLRTFSFP